MPPRTSWLFSPNLNSPTASAVGSFSVGVRPLTRPSYSSHSRDSEIGCHQRHYSNENISFVGKTENIDIQVIKGVSPGCALWRCHRADEAGRTFPS